MFKIVWYALVVALLILPIQAKSGYEIVSRSEILNIKNVKFNFKDSDKGIAAVSVKSCSSCSWKTYKTTATTKFFNRFKRTDFETFKLNIQANIRKTDQVSITINTQNESLFEFTWNYVEL